MVQPSNEETVRRYLAARAVHDHAMLASLRDPDWTIDWPQSGERVRGSENDRAIMDNWPDGPPNSLSVRTVGSGDFWWADGTSAYPDGSTWFISAVLELRRGKMYRETWYFGPPFEAPAWRAAWVERLG